MRLTTILIALSGITLTIALGAAPYAPASERCPDRQMVKRHFFAHDGLDGRTFVDRIRRAGYLRGDGWSLGETLARRLDDAATPEAILAGWLKSAPHRRVILSPGLRHVGIGLVAGTPTGIAEGATVTADFGCRAPAHC